MVATDAPTRQHAFTLLTVLRAGMQASASQFALTAAGVVNGGAIGPSVIGAGHASQLQIESVARVFQEKKYRAFTASTGIVVTQDLMVTPMEFKKISEALTTENRIHECVSELRFNSGSMRQHERRVVLGGGTTLVQEEDDAYDMTKSSHICTQLLRYMIAFAAAGGSEALFIASHPDANTQGAFGRVRRGAAGVIEIHYASWNECFRFFCRAVECSGFVNNRELKTWIQSSLRVANEHMSGGNRNGSSALMKVVMAPLPSPSHWAQGGKGSTGGNGASGGGYSSFGNRGSVAAPELDALRRENAELRRVYGSTHLQGRAGNAPPGVASAAM